MLDKLDWLKDYLRNAGPLEQLPRRFIWLATDRVHIRPGSPQALKLSRHGLVLKGRHLDLRERQA